MDIRMDQRISTRGTLWGGAVAGMIAGLAMAMAAMIYAWTAGAGFWLPVRNIAALWFGVNALVMGASAPFVGVLTHLVNSAVFGIIFAFLIRSRPTTGVAFAGGIAYGIVIWAVMTYVALPLFNETMYERTANANPGWWFVLHLIFGGMLFLAPACMQAFGKPGRSYPTGEPTPA